MKILFTNVNCSINNGSAAQVFSTMKAFASVYKDAQFGLVSQQLYELDQASAQKYEHDSGRTLEIYGYPMDEKPKGRQRLYIYRMGISLLLCFLYRLFSILHISANFLLRNVFLSAYKQADLIVDLSGDSFADHMGGISLINSLGILPAIVLKKPFIIYSQSIGPFRPYSKNIVRFCLKRAKAIILREKISLKVLRSLRVNDGRVSLRPDCAFALDSASDERINSIITEEEIITRNSHLIGISVSRMLEVSNGQYTSIMAKLVDYLANFNTQIILVPHAIRPKWLGSDDRSTARNILDMAQNRARIKVLNGVYDPHELKGVISKCEIFIGCRMHANIAALSLCIPTLAIGWAHKYLGIMSLVGLEEFVFDYQNLEFPELASAAKKLWVERKEIQKRLQERIPDIRKSANGATIVKNVLEGNM